VNTVPDEHRAAAPLRIRCAILTISDTRTIADDRGGAGVQDHLEQAGHQVAERAFCHDDPEQIQAHVMRWVEQPDVDVVLLTGGTGISQRDQTYEALRELLTRELPGYGELFRWLSYQEIGTAAMLSRALGGLVRSTVVLSMPGSPAGVRLAMQRIVLPELGHLVAQARK
jgi:molybdenum cofactor biosynthesis protein B